MDILSLVRLMNLIFVVATLVAWIYFNQRFREPAAFAPITWLVNVLAFYLYRFYILFNNITGNESQRLLNLWVSVLILHGILLLLVGIFIAIPRLLRNKTYMGRLEEKLRREVLEVEKNKKDD